MNGRPWRLYALIAVAAVLVLYARTLHFAFYWDDFDDLRPWTWADLASTFTGQYQPWAREGIYFYRPLTSVYFAAATWLFGLNATWLHTIPLVTLSVAATLAARVAARETGSRAAGVLTALLYVAHPLTATAVGPWIANQYQGFVVIATLAALLAWRPQAMARAGLSVPLAAALIAAAWLKEDGLALGPALLVMHVTRAHWTRDVPPPSRAMILGLVGLATLLVLWRAVWLPAQFGYGLPSPSQIAANLTRAWRYALVWHVGATPIALWITLAKAAVLAWAVWLTARRRDSASTRLIVTAVAVMAVMNLPLGLVSSESRWHVMGLCAVLLTTGALVALPIGGRWIAATLIVLLFAAGSWERISAFGPCSPETLEHNQWALALPELPSELRAWIASRDAACASGHYDAFRVPMRDLTWRTR